MKLEKESKLNIEEFSKITTGISYEKPKAHIMGGTETSAFKIDDDWDGCTNGHTNAIGNCMAGYGVS